MLNSKIEIRITNNLIYYEKSIYNISNHEIIHIKRGNYNWDGTSSYQIIPTLNESFILELQLLSVNLLILFEYYVCQYIICIIEFHEFNNVSE